MIAPKLKLKKKKRHFIHAAAPSSAKGRQRAAGRRGRERKAGKKAGAPNRKGPEHKTFIKKQDAVAGDNVSDDGDAKKDHNTK